jgi:hypothetical protein
MVIMKKKDLWIPQFKDGSGWDKRVKYSPCFYEHITKNQTSIIKNKTKNIRYQITCIVPFPEIPHKNTYFVKGKYLNDFFDMRSEEYIVDIRPVNIIPNYKKKLSQQDSYFSSLLRTLCAMIRR